MFILPQTLENQCVKICKILLALLKAILSLRIKKKKKNRYFFKFLKPPCIHWQASALTEFLF